MVTTEAELREQAEKIWSKIETWGRYGFNKSHATAYAMIAYQTAYLKANYPLEYMCALLRSVADDKDKLSLYLGECRRMGIKVLPPDINESDLSFSIKDGKIMYGLSGIHHVGHAAVEEIMRIREGGPIRSLTDFMARIEDARGLGKQAIEALIWAGAFDNCETHDRATLAHNLPELVKIANKVRQKRKKGTTDIFKLMEPFEKFEFKPSKATKREILLKEKEVLGAIVSYDPTPILNKLKWVNANSKTIDSLPDGRIVLLGGMLDVVNERTVQSGPNKGKKMATFELQDQFGSILCVAYSDAYSRYGDIIKNSLIIAVRGRVVKRGTRAQVVVQEVKYIK